MSPTSPSRILAAAAVSLAAIAVGAAAPALAQTPAEDLDSKWVAICAGATPGTSLGDRCDEILNAGPGSGDRRSEAALGNNLGNAAASSRTAREEREDGLVRELGAWSFFLTASRDDVERDPDAFETGFEDTTDTVLLGVDRRFGASVVLGLALRASDGETEFDGGAGRVETETRAATLYLTAGGSGGRQLFEAYAGVGESEHDSTRNIDYTLVLDQGLPTETTVTLSGVATGSTDGDRTFLGAGWSLDLGDGAWTWGPALRADRTEVEIDAWSETDDIGLALAYDAQDVTSLNASAGLQVHGALSRSWGSSRRSSASPPSTSSTTTPARSWRGSSATRAAPTS